MMKTVRVFVGKGNKTAITCPFCQKTNEVSVGKFKNLKHTVVTKCSCQQQFTVELNFRQYHRKKVELNGEVRNVSTGSSKWLEVTVVDLSMVGLRFKVVEATDIEKDHILRVRFTLDNQKATEIEKEVGVLNRKNDEFGCEFLFIDYEKELGFYLRS
ncbi:MAG: PilZ domain-containing protein [Desulfofustis sp.]|nr:PilZ domain-containing protein [Desulfofustis sp.]RZW25004.1 MAG: PilZ domain-containing protein [Desulfobulbaceae bacterium]